MTVNETIQIVDDNPNNLKLLFDYLQEANFNVIAAPNGERALKQVKLNPPDLILLDVLMPGIDGFETCHQLKADRETKDIPVIFMTALSETADKVKGFDVGAVDYITKPFQQEEVLARVKTHLTLKHQKQALLEANATKDKLFSIIAHDLKNAFATMLGYADLIADEAAEKELEYLLDAANNLQLSTKNSYRLLENLLSWSLVNQGKTRFKPIELDFCSTIREGVTRFKQPALQKNITIVSHVSAGVFVYADLNMVRTVIRNLISNAIKFTPRDGAITITVEIKDSFLHCDIADTGIGMTTDQTAELFNISRQYRSYGTDGEMGTGLGLILCKSLIDLNGGQISATSQVGAGSVFRFTLPILLHDKPPHDTF